MAEYCYRGDDNSIYDRLFLSDSCASCSLMFSYLTRQLSYRKEDRAMRQIDGCPEKFESPH